MKESTLIQMNKKIKRLELRVDQMLSYLKFLSLLPTNAKDIEKVAKDNAKAESKPKVSKSVSDKG